MTIAIGLVAGLLIGWLTARSRWKEEPSLASATNVFAIVPLTYCMFVGEDAPDLGQHATPVPARVVYHETGRMWRAECPICGAHSSLGATPHEAARLWNAQQTKAVRS